ncbi:MAG: hypothetical protein WCF20_08400 [Methylovirgula sp.]
MGMRHYVIVSFALFTTCAISGPAFADCTGKPAFEDTFQTMDPSWGTADANAFVENGALVIKPKPGYNRYDLSQSDYYGDGSICVLATIAEASNIAQVQAMVLFWAAPDYLNMYLLNIGSDGKQGYYKIDRLSSGHWLTPVGWTSDPAIKFNLGDTNEVEIQMAGRTATVVINGKKMLPFHGNPPDGGALIGVGGGAGQGVNAKVTFQKFQFFKAANP